MKFLLLSSLVLTGNAFSPVQPSFGLRITKPTPTPNVALLAATNGESSQSESTSTSAATTSMKKVLVLGGDGFCGWPTSLFLSDQGHDVVIVDNLSRRNIDVELGCDSLTPIQSPDVSTVQYRRWQLATGVDCVVLCSIDRMGLTVLFDCLLELQSLTTTITNNH